MVLCQRFVWILEDTRLSYLPQPKCWTGGTSYMPWRQIVLFPISSVKNSSLLEPAGVEPVVTGSTSRVRPWNPRPRPQVLSQLNRSLSRSSKIYDRFYYLRLVYSTLALGSLDNRVNRPVALERNQDRTD